MCELKPKKNRVGDVGCWTTCPDLRGVKILHVIAFGRPVRKKPTKFRFSWVVLDE